MADTSIPDAPLGALLDSVPAGDSRLATPAASAERQPIHTMYGGAHLFRSDSTARLGALAQSALHEYAPDAAAIAEIAGIEGALIERLYPRVVAKLKREPIEDYRIDFEDGFGDRSDEEEDRVAQSSADELAASIASNTRPPAVGIRVKPLNDQFKRRSLRTFDLFLTRIAEHGRNSIPPNFVVTLPKIVVPEQVAALASACDAFEYWRELPHGSIKIELMIETPQSLVSSDGRVALPRFVSSGGGRVVGLHFGPYDYTAACGITAAYQDLRHPACDFARHLMLVSSAGLHVRLSDGPTTLLPIAPRRAAPGSDLSATDRETNTRTVHRAWRLHAEHIRHALVNGFYQGWDLHPAQLPIRYAVVYAFFLQGLDAASDRLRNFVAHAAQATRVGDVFDDAATGQGLLNYFLRALNCGAITEDEAVERSGLTLDELRSRSFAEILSRRLAG